LAALHDLAAAETVCRLFGADLEDMKMLAFLESEIRKLPGD
jgi:hypothetical protein